MLLTIFLIVHYLLCILNVHAWKIQQHWYVHVDFLIITRVFQATTIRLMVRDLDLDSKHDVINSNLNVIIVHQKTRVCKSFTYLSILWPKTKIQIKYSKINNGNMLSLFSVYQQFYSVWMIDYGSKYILNGYDYTFPCKN